MPSPKWEFFIDFDEDGVFDADEEIASDMRTALLTGIGKDLSTRRPRSGQLRVILNNKDHKYTPTNTASPLFPFQLPGPDCMLRGAYPLDAFGGENGDVINGRDFPLATDQGKSDPNYGAWVADTPFEVRSNHVEITSGGGQRIAQVEAPTNFLSTLKTCWGAKITREGTGIVHPYKQSLFVFRYQNAGNYNEIALEQTSSSSALNIKINKIVAGVLSNHGSAVIENDIASIWAEGAQAHVEFWIQNLEVVVYVDGHVATLHRNISQFLVEGRVGIGGEFLSTNAVAGGAGTRRVQWDDFGGWCTKFTGRVDLIEPHPAQQEQSATITAFDDLERAQLDLVGKSTVAPSSAGAIFNVILDGIGIADTKRIVDSGTSSLATDFEKTLSRNGYTEMIQLMEDDVGFFWIDGHGVYHYEDTDHRTSIPHTVPAADIRDTRAGALTAAMRAPIIWDDGMRRVQNEAFYRYFRAVRSSGAQIWTLEVDDNIATDNTRSKIGSANQYFADDIGTIGEEANAINVRVPRPTVDFNINELEGGGGNNWLNSLASNTGTVSMPSDLSQLDDTGQNFQASTSIGAVSFTHTRRIIVVTDASDNWLTAYIEFGNPDGDGTRVNLSDEPENGGLNFLMKDASFSVSNTPLTYNVYTSGGYIIPGFEGNFQIYRIIVDRAINDAAKTSWIVDAQIVGERLTQSNPTAARAVDSASALRYGRRQFDHQTLHLDLFTRARGRAEALVAARKDSKSSFNFSLINKEYADLQAALFCTVSDRLDMFYAAMGLTSTDYFLEGITMNITNGGKILTATWETLEA